MPARHLHRRCSVHAGRAEEAVVEVHGRTKTRNGGTKRRESVELLAASLRCLDRVGGVGLVPLHVTRRPVDRRDVLPSQTESVRFSGTQITTPGWRSGSPAGNLPCASVHLGVIWGGAPWPLTPIGHHRPPMARNDTHFSRRRGSALARPAPFPVGAE